ncbi:YdaU family protein [Asticcacaulis endophyticus]|uniref:DUF1376 domain-containing protein n=1 Tax=Asticcacaulis endophyticus TaxID=1395890 RepID=A0A918PT56_9CAUL|nr:YdaU family protein [Asticcacaulis endophyticus]GGZ21840.1 hypothetical protein GCM10011273_03280 [Asticcacaulis endophyticus]
MSDLKINTYPMHIGDWHSGTSRMSLAERGAYITLCHQYYLDQGEGWTVTECLRICAAMAKDEQKAVKSVLASKFIQADGGYRHDGMDKRIGEIKTASERNQDRARIAAEKRWGSNAQAPIEDAISNATSMPEALLEECHPKTKSQKPKEAIAKSPKLEGKNWPERNQIMAELGKVCGPGIVNPHSTASMIQTTHAVTSWLAMGYDWRMVRQVIDAKTRKSRVKPITTWSWFNDVMREAHEVWVPPAEAEEVPDDIRKNLVRHKVKTGQWMPSWGPEPTWAEEKQIRDERDAA